MKLCMYCLKRPAKVPDRNNYYGKFVKKVCSECHSALLRGDLIEILHKENTKPKDTQ